MKKYTMGFLFSLSLIFGYQSSGMQQEKLALVPREKVYQFVSSYLEAQEKSPTFYEIEEKISWEGDTNTEGYRDPQIFIYKSYNGQEQKEFVVKAVLARSDGELRGSNALVEHLGNNLTFMEGSTELRFFPILFHQYVESEIQKNNEKQRVNVLLELMDRAPGIPLRNWFYERYNNNTFSNYKEVQDMYHSIGNAVACMHNQGVSHHDLHMRNILIAKSSSNGTICSIIDWDRPKFTTDSYLSDIEKFAFEAFLTHGAIGDSRGYKSLKLVAREAQMLHRTRMGYNALTGFLCGYIGVRAQEYYLSDLYSFVQKIRDYFSTTFCVMFEASECHGYETMPEAVNIVQNNAMELIKKFKDKCLNKPIEYYDLFDKEANTSTEDPEGYLKRHIERLKNKWLCKK